MKQEIPNFEIFPNAPIREAIFEIGIEPLPYKDGANLECLHSKFANHYPELKPIQIFEKTFTLEVDEKGTPCKEPGKDKTWIQGYQMWATNKQELHTCRLDGFSYNRLKPYKDGNDAIQKTLNGWKIFQEEIGQPPI